MYSTVITFLGIELDSVAQEVRLPAEKLTRLRESPSRFEHKRHATKHELQVLIGILSHAAAVVRPGRVFSSPTDHAKCRSDLAWWSVFVKEWNGLALFPSMHARGYQCLFGRLRILGHMTNDRFSGSS